MSTASIWEVSVKHQVGRLALPQPPERFLPEQRKRHGFLTLLTPDPLIAQYPVRISW